VVSPDGLAPSRMVGVSASVDLSLHHEVQKFSSGTGSPGWSRKKGRKMVVEVYYFKILQWRSLTNAVGHCQSDCGYACVALRLSSHILVRLHRCSKAVRIAMVGSFFISALCTN